MSGRVTIGLVYNPAAGLGRKRSGVESVVATLRDAGATVELFPTQGPGDGEAQARRAAECCAVVAVYGGDGSVNEAVNGIVASGRNPALLPLPGGTMNVLCRDLGIPLDPRRAAGLAFTGRRRRIFLGRASWPGGARYFTLMAGCGLDAAVVATMNARAGAKRLLGPWAFALEAWRVILRHPFPQVRVTIGDGQYCGYDVVIGKSRLYGGWMQVTPGADVGAPSFQVAICRGRRVLPYFVYVARALAGTLQRSPDHVFLSCSRLTVESDGEVLVQADGDLLGRLPMTFEIDGAAVEALTAAAAAAP